MKMVRLAAVAAMFAAAAGAAPVSAATLTIIVTNVRNAHGMVHVDLCREKEFLKDCAISAEVKSVVGSTTLRINNVAPGDYAVQGTQDENNNKKVDQGLFGIPKEGVGFSNDAPIGFSAPSWNKAKFTITGDKTITFRLRYFTGASGPPASK